MSTCLSRGIRSGVRCGRVPRPVVGRVSIILISTVVRRLPFPTLITVVRRGVSRFVALIVDLVAGIDGDVVPTNVSIDGVITLVLIV